jgi:hypothetical protein
MRPNGPFHKTAARRVTIQYAPRPPAPDRHDAAGRRGPATPPDAATGARASAAGAHPPNRNASKPRHPREPRHRARPRARRPDIPRARPRRAGPARTRRRNPAARGTQDNDEGPHDRQQRAPPARQKCQRVAATGQQPTNQQKHKHSHTLNQARAQPQRHDEPPQPHTTRGNGKGRDRRRTRQIYCKIRVIPNTGHSTRGGRKRETAPRLTAPAPDRSSTAGPRGPAQPSNHRRGRGDDGGSRERQRCAPPGQQKCQLTAAAG